MKVLLLQDVKKVGRRMEVKEVSDGYARNFLIAKKLAVPADEAAMKFKSEADRRENDSVGKYRQLAELLKSEALEFGVRTGEKGEVFGSVTSEQIKKALREKGLGEPEVALKHPLRSIGEHRVEVNFSRGIKGEARVSLVPEPLV
jgi:large subunit ribosomal protein L9